MREILVIRFGALGDLCVLGWTLSRLVDSHAPGTCRVTLVTKAAFAPLMAQIRGVDQVIPLNGSGVAGVLQLAATLRQQRWDVIVDAHNVLRSHLLLALLRRRANARLAKDTAARLGFMTFGRQHKRLDRSMRDRFDAVVAEVISGDLAVTNTPPLTRLQRPSSLEPGTRPTPSVGLAPGAQWDTKRWPEENFAELLQLIRQQVGGTIRVYLGPREQNWFPTSALARAAAADNATEIVQVPDLTIVAGSLANTDLLVTNDSGLLHVAEAVGTPVLAFFGPTVREFGYFPLLQQSQVLESEVSCRPCSRNGKRACPDKDLVCLREITPDRAVTALVNLLPAGPSS